MRLLIVAATPQESLLLLETYKFEKIQTNLFAFISQKLRIDFLITGAGIMHSSAFLMKHLQLNTAYDLVLNIGICGAFSEQIEIGKTVEIISEILGDFGAEDDEKFLTAFEIGLLENKHFPFQNGRIEIPKHQFSHYFKDLPKVSSMTVNKAHGNEKSIQLIKEKLHADVENMEGAACAFICRIMHVPFSEIRTVSNVIEKRNKAAWKIDFAIEENTKAIQNFIQQLIER